MRTLTYKASSKEGVVRSLQNLVPSLTLTHMLEFGGMDQRTYPSIHGYKREGRYDTFYFQAENMIQAAGIAQSLAEESKT